MKKFNRRKKDWLEKIEGEKYNLDESIALLKEFSNLQFDSSDLSLRN